MRIRLRFLELRQHVLSRQRALLVVHRRGLDGVRRELSLDRGSLVASRGRPDVVRPGLDPVTEQWTDVGAIFSILERPLPAETTMTVFSAILTGPADYLARFKPGWGPSRELCGPASRS